VAIPLIVYNLQIYLKKKTITYYIESNVFVDSLILCNSNSILFSIKFCAMDYFISFLQIFIL